MSTYTWTQTPDQVSVSFVLPVEYVGKPTVVILAKSLTVSAGRHVFVSGMLYQQVNHHDSLWQVETTRKGRMVTVHLEKHALGDEWPVLISSALPSAGMLDETSEYNLALHAEATDARRAFELYEAGAGRGFVPAMLKLAAFYEVGRENAPQLPVAHDATKAFTWHKKAADAPVTQWNGEEVAEASYLVASSYQTGHSVKVDYASALQYYARSASIVQELLAKESQTPSSSPTLSSAGSPRTPISMQSGPMKLVNLASTCLFQAGLLHFEGHATLKQDYDKARQNWERAALVSSHAQSMYNLGVLYLNGWGVESKGGRNVVTALELMRQAIVLDPDSKLTLPDGLEEAAATSIKDEMVQQMRAKSQTAAAVPALSAAGAETSSKAKRRSRRVHKTRKQTSSYGVLPWLAISVAALGVGVVVYRQLAKRN